MSVDHDYIPVGSIHNIIFGRNMASMDFSAKLKEFDDAEIKLKERMLKTVPEEIQEMLGVHLDTLFRKGYVKFKIPLNPEGIGGFLDVMSNLSKVKEEWKNAIDITCSTTSDGCVDVAMSPHLR